MACDVMSSLTNLNVTSAWEGKGPASDWLLQKGRLETRYKS